MIKLQTDTKVSILATSIKVWTFRLLLNLSFFPLCLQKNQRHPDESNQQDLSSRLNLSQFFPFLSWMPVKGPPNFFQSDEFVTNVLLLRR